VRDLLLQFIEMALVARVKLVWLHRHAVNSPVFLSGAAHTIMPLSQIKPGEFISPVFVMWSK
jgi:hypothetical protein